ncbi:Rrf2 family transcriptional regulator [Fibrobacteres bacterium R8-0-B4]
MLLDLAEHSDGGFVPLLDIAERQGISKQYLEQIIFLLNTSKILRAKRGTHGGYMLADVPSKITVGSVLRVTDIALTAPADCGNEADKCSKAAHCKTLPMWTELENMINDYLDGITLQDLIDQRRWSGNAPPAAS